MYELMTPILIDFDNNTWIHPDIEDLLEWEINGINLGKWSYNKLTRVYIENDKKQTVYMVVLSEELENGNIPLDELQMQLEVALFEDVWSPGGEQFCFSNFGDKLSKTFGYGNTKITFVSPDVGVEDVSGKYSWSS